MNAPSTVTPTPTDEAKPVRSTPRAKAEHALEATRDTAREAVRRTAQGIEANPLAVLVSGVALGVLAGAVIPRTEQEGKLLRPVGKRLTDTAAGAAQAAKEAGKAELDALGLNKAAARDQVGKLLDGVVKALSSAGSAAASRASSK